MSIFFQIEQRNSRFKYDLLAKDIINFYKSIRGVSNGNERRIATGKD